jgi:sorbitol-specific phosphotransferase system component IIBC
MVSSLSSLIAVILSVGLGRFYAQSVYPLAVALLLAGIVALFLVLAADRNQAGEI